MMTEPNLAFSTPLPEYLDAHLDAILTQGVEHTKVDFKRQLNLSGASDKEEFLKDIASIANSDHPAYGGYGYVLLGVEGDGTVCGLDEGFDVDKVSAQLDQLVQTYLAPPLELVLTPLRERDGQRFSVLVLPPSTQQPHVVAKSLGNFNAGEVWVRSNGRKEKARGHDYQRFLQTSLERRLGPLRDDLVRLGDRLRQVQDSQEEVRLAVATGQHLRPSSVPGVRAATMLRQRFEDEAEDLERALRREVADFVDAYQAACTSLPEAISAPNDPALSGQISHLEELTRPLGEALFLALHYLQGQALEGAVEHAFAEAARAVRYPPNFDSPHLRGPSLRLYPLMLMLFCAAMGAQHQGRFGVLRRLLDFRFSNPHGGQGLPIPYALVMGGNLNDVLVAQNLAWPPIALSGRLHRVIAGRGGWLSDAPLYERAVECALDAELTLGLLITTATQRNQYVTSFPHLGWYLTDAQANAHIQRWLERHHPHLMSLLGEQPAGALEAFDTSVRQSRSSWPGLVQLTLSLNQVYASSHPSEPR